MTQFLRFLDADAWLAAATDAGFMADDTLYFSGLDPLANTFDLSTDPLAHPG